jgi:hypothetical protein
MVCDFAQKRKTVRQKIAEQYRGLRSAEDKNQPVE